MSRNNHLLSRWYELLLLECSSWHLCNLTRSMRSLICGRRSRQGWILLRSFSRNESYVFELYPLHHSASIRFADCHTTSWSHGMVLTIWVCLHRSCGLRRVRGIDWSPKLNHFLCNYLPRIVSIDRWLIIARYLNFRRVSDSLARVSTTLYPLSSEHRTLSLLLRIFNLIRVCWCHHVRSLWSLCLLLNYTICF